MYRRFHDRFGTAGVVIAIIALVAALGGTALAAGGLTAKQKKEVKTIAKSFQGTGPAGPQGSPGAPGAQGSQGARGDQGDQGEPGEPGEPWTPDNELPAGATLTGAYSLPSTTANLGTNIGEPGMDDGDAAYVPVNFPIPLGSSVTFKFVPSVLSGENAVIGSAAPDCPGLSGGAPQAASGKLCVYGAGATAFGFLIPSATVTTVSATSGTGSGVSPAGTVLKLTCSSPEFEVCIGKGVWAVTG